MKSDPNLEITLRQLCNSNNWSYYIAKTSLGIRVVVMNRATVVCDKTEYTQKEAIAIVLLELT